MRLTRLPMTRLPVILFAAAGLLLAGGLAPVALRTGGSGSQLVSVPGHGTTTSRLAVAIANYQDRLRTVPADWGTWARLGSAYIEQARVTGDPTYYPRGEGALRRSLELSTTTNWQAMVGLGSLANARHDFHTALSWGRRAEAVNPAAGSVHGVIADALTQLGDAPAARAATQRMLDVDPGVASFTRASYDFEQHGQTTQARAALERAAADATDSADLAYCRYYLGELAFNNGDPAAAVVSYDAGLRADPTYQPLRAGRARAYLALGRTAEALRDYDLAVRALPLPHLVAEYGDALTATGDTAAARRQYDLRVAQQRLFTEAGMTDHLADAVYLADHGSPAEALNAARTEWAARRHVLVADALAWALHRNGQDREALQYAMQTTALGWNNATFLYHRGAIHHALGDTVQARRDLSAALAINPHFDPLQAPVARQLLDTLGGPA